MKLKLNESQLTKLIRDYLKLKGVFHWKQHQGLGSTKGVPDIIGVLKGGRSLFIEVKTSRGTVSPEQENFLNNARALGAKAFVARSVDDVVRELEAA